MKLELAETADADANLARTATMEGSRAPKRPSAIALEANQRLGHFKIERKLGEGGMGEVYLAIDLALDRPVAIKVLPQKSASSSGHRDRMIREARAQARVMHPNVGHIYFIGEEEGCLYFAMEYVVGKTLGELISEGPLKPEAALGFIREAALGLREAQRNGFTHRDVKPSNLMVDAHGNLKVLDFGLAAGGDLEAANDGPVAQTHVAGTPLYMAPEQARGDAIDFRADIYALGVTLFQLVTGNPPFVADSAAELRSLHESAPRPAVVRRGLAKSDIESIDALCTRMMATNPEERFASYDELIRAIELASQIHTMPAGFWARSIATTIDYASIFIVTSLLELLYSTITHREDASVGGFVVYALFALYVIGCQTRWGRTLGAALFELEVVDIRTARKPNLATAIRRFAYLFTLPTITGFSRFVLPHQGKAMHIVQGVEALWFVLLFMNLNYAVHRTAGKRTWWDRRSHTMVRYRMKRAVQP